MFTLMIVEDNADFRELLKDMLENEFPAVRVTEAASAEQALEAVEKERPDLVFVDIKLPGMNGLELAKRLRIRFRDVVLVALTSYDISEYREAATKYKVDHYLLKGLSTRIEILELVKSILIQRPTT